MKDLIILGNGMAGMTAALYAARANLDFKIVGKSEYDFGQIGNAILVENFPCAESQSGFDLACKLHDQLQDMGVKIEEGEVKAIHSAGRELTYPDKTCRPPFIIEYADRTGDTAKTIIYALGASHRQLNCEIEDGVPIHYCALCDGSFYKDKTVAVIGGGDSAFTQAEYLSKICKQVLIVMCDNNITANAQVVKRVQDIKNIIIIFDYPIIRIEKLSNGQYGLFGNPRPPRVIANSGLVVNGIFVAIGMIPNTQLLLPFIQVVVDKQGYIYANDVGGTTVEGLFVAGDVKEKAVRQAITAASDGACAVQGVINYLKTHGE